MNTVGFIKLSRTLLEHEIWTCERFTKGQAWVDLLMMANFEENDKMYNGHFQKVKRGQIATSIDFLAKRWHWQWKTTKKYLIDLQKIEMIRVEIHTKYTLVTIENYASFQDTYRTDDRADDRTEYRTNDRTEYRQHKNIRNKEYKKEAIPFVEGIGY